MSTTIATALFTEQDVTDAYFARNTDIGNVTSPDGYMDIEKVIDEITETKEEYEKTLAQYLRGKEVLKEGRLVIGERFKAGNPLEWEAQRLGELDSPCVFLDGGYVATCLHYIGVGLRRR